MLCGRDFIERLGVPMQDLINRLQAATDLTQQLMVRL
jgi:hypothetical protein